jgi:hypothetical protein
MSTITDDPAAIKTLIGYSNAKQLLEIRHVPTANCSRKPQVRRSRRPSTAPYA